MKRVISIMLCIAICAGMIWFPVKSVKASMAPPLPNYQLKVYNFNDGTTQGFTSRSFNTTVSAENSELKVVNSSTNTSYVNPDVNDTTNVFGDIAVEFDVWAPKDESTGKWFKNETNIALRVRQPTSGKAPLDGWRFKIGRNIDGVLQAWIEHPTGLPYLTFGDTNSSYTDPNELSAKKTEATSRLYSNLDENVFDENGKATVRVFVRGETVSPNTNTPNTSKVLLAMNLNDDPKPVVAFLDKNSWHASNRKTYGVISLLVTGTTARFDNIKVTGFGVDDSAKEFDQKSSEDFAVPISITTFMNDRTVDTNVIDSVKLGESTLVKGTDYKISNDGRSLIFSNAFMKTLDPGSKKLSVTFADMIGVVGGYGGDSAANPWVITTQDFHYNDDSDYSDNEKPNYVIHNTVNVNVKGPAIATTSSSYDKVKDSGDLNIAYTAEGDTVASIFNGENELVKDTDYTVDASNITIKESYLKSKSLTPGSIPLTIKFASGVNKIYTLKITIPVATTITLDGEANVNVPNQGDPNVTAKYSAVVIDQYGDEMLEESVDWAVEPALDKTVAGNEVTLTVKSSSIAGNYTLTATSKSNAAVKAQKTIELIPAGAPSWPEKTAIVFSEVDYEGLTLSWPAAQDANGTIVGYAVYGYNSNKDEVVCSSVYSVTYSVYGSTYSTNVSGLLPGKDYSFKVKALDNDGIWSPVGLSGTVTTKVDQKPYWLESKSLAASDITTTGLKLVWSGADDDRGVTGYVILKDGVEIAAVSDSVYSYQVSGLTHNTSYQFKILAKDSYQLSESGPELTISTLVGIQDSAISPAAATFYQYYSVSQDVTVDLTLNGNTLAAIKNGSTTLTEGTDYIKGDNKVIIKRDYLKTLSEGNVTLTFSFSAGKDAALVITVVNNYTPGSSSRPPVVIENKDAVTVDKSGNAVVKTEVKVDTKTGTAKVAVDKDSLKKAFETAKEVDGKKTAVINVEKSEGAKAYTAEFPKDYIAGNSDKTVLKVNTELGSIVIPGNMVQSSKVKDNESVGITISPVDPATLSKEAKAQVGNRPTIKLELLIGGKASSWDSDNSKVQVSIPYKPTAEELANPEHIVVRYIDGKGNVVSIPSGKYDAATGTVTFETNHFSIYAVAYVNKTFADIKDAEWARKVIEVLASKGVINGTSETTFDPQANITRADYLVLLVKTLGLNAEVDSNFKDVAKKDYYYNAVGIARKLGIASGDGTNFDPRSMITRQDMMVLTEKALRIAGKVGADKAKLDSFKDSGDISAYAKDSMAVLLKAGLIAGSDNMINPLSNATRAETAAFMYKIYNLK